jgi:hypothetical protein
MILSLISGMPLSTSDRSSDCPQVRGQVQRGVRPPSGALQGQRGGRDLNLIGGLEERRGRKIVRKIGGRKEKLESFSFFFVTQLVHKFKLLKNKNYSKYCLSDIDVV